MRSSPRCEAPSLDAVTDETGRVYRKFAEQTGSDVQGTRGLHARPARPSRRRSSPAIRMPVLIAVGSKDKVAGSAKGSPRLIPGAEVLVIPNRDHMLATGDKAFKEAVLDFLARRP